MGKDKEDAPAEAGKSAVKDALAAADAALAEAKVPAVVDHQRVCVSGLNAKKK